MNARWCHRCQAELAAHEEGTLQFCSHCGAPQIQLSEELRDRAEMRTASAALGEVAGHAPAAAALDRAAARRRDITRFGLLSAGVAAGLALFSAAAPPMLPISWFWAVISPIVLLGLFQARMPQTRITTGLGARIGLLAGLANSVAMGSLYSLALFVARRAHWLGSYDRNVQSVFHDVQTQVIAQSTAQANPAGLEWAQSLSVPEFRAGMMLGSLFLVMLLLLVLSTAGGAFAGFMRSRRA